MQFIRFSIRHFSPKRLIKRGHKQPQVCEGRVESMQAITKLVQPGCWNVLSSLAKSCVPHCTRNTDFTIEGTFSTFQGVIEGFSFRKMCSLHCFDAENVFYLWFNFIHCGSFIYAWGWENTSAGF